MSHAKIHLIAPAGACRPFLEALDVPSAAALITLVQDAVGSAYDVSANEALIEASEDEFHGGRQDDRLRAADIEQALADDEVAAIVMIRGGAWFTRVLPLIDFSVLDGRDRPVAVFGFSELTTLVNIVGAHTRAIGVYDMGPAFLTYGLHRYARQQADGVDPGDHAPRKWAATRLLPELSTFLGDVVSMIEGRGSARPVVAELTRGALPDRCDATFVGGNLTVLSTLIGSRFEAWFGPEGRWLLIEDFNDKLERIDRFLAHLTLAGLWERCAGILLGDFHRGYQDLTPAVIELMDYHLPSGRSIPVLTTKQIGHVWPMSPLPLHVPLTIERRSRGEYTIHWPPSALRTV